MKQVCSISFFTVFFIILSFSLNNLNVFAYTVSHSGDEVEYEYQTSFRSLVRLSGSENPEDFDAIGMAHFHAEHLFGLFHSPEYAEKFGVPADLIEGFAGTKHPDVLEAHAFKKENDPHLWIQYTGAGKMLVLTHVLNGWLGEKQEGTIELPLLQDLPAIYLNEKVTEYKDEKWKKCTDSHYISPYDFSYFYNPYRILSEEQEHLCSKLAQSPIATNVLFHIKKMIPPHANNTFPLQEITGDNKNGKLTVLYFTYGYDDFEKLNEDLDDNALRKAIEKDASWKLYKALGTYLSAKKRGFIKMKSLEEFRNLLGEDFNKLTLHTPIKLDHIKQKRFFSTYVKKTEKHTWIVRSALFSTKNETKSRPLRSFPKYWAEAWENGDFIYFGGHSGDGESLSVRNLLENLEETDLNGIHFHTDKTQVAFFDACSSYAHYQKMYARKNPHLHLITYGLVSLFHTAKITAETVLNAFLNPSNIQNQKWENFLESLEKAQLKPHLRFLYYKEQADQAYRDYLKKKKYPSFLLNAWIPENN